MNKTIKRQKMRKLLQIAFSKNHKDKRKALDQLADILKLTS